MNEALVISFFSNVHYITHMDDLSFIVVYTHLQTESYDVLWID